MIEPKVRGGKLQFVRFGPLRPMRQTHTSAPERRGAYAFLWVGEWDWYFASHRFDLLVPKKLRRSNWDFNKLPIEGVRELDNLRDQWIRQHRNICRPKVFRYSGPIYARFDRTGKIIGHPDFLPNEWWYYDSIHLYYEAAQRGPLRRRSRDGSVTRYGVDHLEVFLPNKI